MFNSIVLRPPIDGSAATAGLESSHGALGEFGVTDVSRLALVCSDVAATMDLYSGVPGLPLVLLREAQLQGAVTGHAQVEQGAAPGTQHFFFDMGNGNVLAFFCFPDRRPDAGRRDVAVEEPSADASAHHLAFEIPSDSLPRAWARLEAEGVPFHFSDPDGVKREPGAWCEPAVTRALGAHDEYRARSGGYKLASLA